VIVNQKETQMSSSLSVRSFVAGLALAFPVAAQGGVKPAPGVEKDPPKSGGTVVGGREALKACRDLAAQIKGLKGPTRDSALEEAAKAYEHVAAEYAADRGLAAQAWYEAAELWRRGDDLPQAETAYGKAITNDSDRYAERSLLEVGNLQRRQKRFDDAVATYKKLVALNPKSSRGHDARLWIGRTLQQKGTWPQAVAAYTEAVEAAPALLDRIEASDWLVKALVHTGELDKAGQVVDSIEKAGQEVTGPEAARVQKALEGLSGKRALQKARDKATQAHKGAEAAEKVKGREVKEK
jgi:tetratricopeptide (TPR) repeat protein